MLLKELIRAARGGALWKRLQVRYGGGSTLFLAFPHEDPVCNYYGLRCASVYAKMHGFQKIVIVCTDPVLQKAATELVAYPHETHFLTGSEMDRLIRYLAMHVDFIGLCTVSNARIITLDNLQGKALRTLHEHSVFTTEHLVWSRMYNKPIDCVTGVELPEYHYSGDDEQLQAFFCRAGVGQ